MHFVGPDQHHGFEERWTQEIYPTTFDWTYPSRDGVYVPPEGTGQSLHRVYKSGIGWTPDMDYDEEVLFRTLYGLRRIARQDDRRPFLLCASFTGPHYPYYAPEPYWNLYTDDDIELPHIPEDFKKGEHQYVDWFRQYAHLEEPVPEEVCRRARHAMLGRISMLDDYLSSILDALKTSGLDKETIVLYTSDHGDMMGEHGLWFKCTAYEWSSRVPLIVSGPGIPQHRVEEPVSLLDLGPTLCSIAGIDPVYSISDGRDVSDLVYDERSEGEGDVIVEYYGDGTWRGWRMIRSGDYKLVHIPGYEPALYNLREDRGEWHNLTRNPRYQGIVEDLRARVLDNWEPEVCDEKRWQSQERRVAILQAIEKSEISLDWQTPSPPVPHPSSEPK
jgi:choline-sulfatase